MSPRFSLRIKGASKMRHVSNLNNEVEAAASAIAARTSLKIC